MLPLPPDDFEIFLMLLSLLGGWWRFRRRLRRLLGSVMRGALLVAFCVIALYYYTH